MTSLGWSTQKYAALNDCQIRISSGGETKKIRVLVSDVKTSLAKSPNAHYMAIYGKNDTNFFNSGMGIKGLRIADWRQGEAARRRLEDRG